MVIKTIPLTDQAPNYEDPYVEIRDFVYRYGNPIYIYQGGTDDDLAIISTEPLPGATRKMQFDIADTKLNQ